MDRTWERKKLSKFTNTKEIILSLARMCSNSRELNLSAKHEITPDKNSEDYDLHSIIVKIYHLPTPHNAIPSESWSV